MHVFPSDKLNALKYARTRAQHLHYWQWNDASVTRWFHSLALHFWSLSGFTVGEFCLLRLSPAQLTLHVFISSQMFCFARIPATQRAHYNVFTDVEHVFVNFVCIQFYIYIQYQIVENGDNNITLKIHSPQFTSFLRSEQSWTFLFC